jgi:hypothetical protein
MRTYVARPKRSDGGQPAPPSPARHDPVHDPLSPGSLARMQSTAGNKATSQLVAQRLTVQREVATSQAESIARQLEDAMSGLGTDEEAIFGALAGRTGDDMVSIREAYKRLFNENLDAELRDELSGDDLAKVDAMTASAVDVSTTSAGARQTAAMDRAALIAGQLHDAMEGLGTEEDQIFNALTGRTPHELEEISRYYQARYSHPLEDDLRDELSGSDLDKALTLIGQKDTGTFLNSIQQNMTEGGTTVVQGRFEYTLTADKLEIAAPVHFVPDAGVTVPIADWNTKIDNIWNKFKIKEVGGREVKIHMALRDDTADTRKINVVDNAVTGTYAHPDRANAGKWYPIMPDSTAPHEFGHLIGLPDEYQRTAADFEAITGETRTGPANASGKTAAAIATELNTALTGSPAAGRPAAATTVLVNAGLIAGGTPKQGDFAASVMAAYDAANTPHLFPVLQGLDSGSNWTLMTVFSFASGTIMGDPAQVGTLAHEHPVMPHHLREFRSIVWNRWPALDWKIE